ncbi:MAG TPA: N-acetylmuramoyl-L-alanine amidase [Chthonomonadaceae bacterium]|nr:N-acetylmuramoyl-L-alanine amidase [Chthonomonadaceae bacterium]
MCKRAEGSGTPPRSRCWSGAAPAALLAALVCAAAVPALAEGETSRATPIHFWAAGRMIPLATPAISVGRDIYVPTSALPAVGAHATLGTKRNGVTVRLRSGRIDVLPFIRRNGAVMISLTDLAESTDGTVIRPSATPAKGLKPNTAYLLAHITDVHLKANELHVVTSFPVPFVSNTVSAASGRGYVDCIGAVAARDFRASRLPAAEHRAERVRVGQFTPNIARVVVDLAPGVTLERNSTEGKVTPTFVAALEPGGRTVARTEVSPRAAHRTSTDGDAGEVPPSTHRVRGSQTTIPEDYAKGEGDTGATGTTGAHRRPRTSEADATDKPRATTTPTRTGEIRGIAYESQDNQTIQIVITTSRKLRAYVRYSATARQMIIDIPNSRLNLEDDRQKEQDIQHPLVEGLSASTVQSSPRVPPLTRITVDAPRIVSTSIESDRTQIVVEITVPRTSRLLKGHRGSIGGKLVVVDAGHGGAMTGAKAHVRKHTIYEKDVTLAIAKRLRAALVARGAHVVMTRVGDKNVDLEDRPEMANQVGANIFISIHNDSWGKANSITGTTAYYHGQSAASRRLARCVEKELAAVSGLRDRGAVSDTTMYPVGFCVLRDTNMPSILCEVGYLNNRKDRAKLMDSAFQRRVAEAMANGIRDYANGGLKTARRRARRSAISA